MRQAIFEFFCCLNDFTSPFSDSRAAMFLAFRGFGFLGKRSFPLWLHSLLFFFWLRF